MTPQPTGRIRGNDLVLSRRFRASIEDVEFGNGYGFVRNLTARAARSNIELTTQILKVFGGRGLTAP